MKHYLIHDTLEAFVKSGDDLYFFGMTTNGNINKAVNQEQIRAGIGNNVVAVMSTDNEVDFSITTGLHYHEVYEIQTGQKFEESADVVVQDVEIDDQGVVTATEKTVTADVLDIKSDSFPRNHTVQLRSIVYDPDTNQVVADIFFTFDRALPDGALAETFEAGNKTSEISFMAQVDADGNYGKIIVVPRDQPTSP